MSYLKYMWKSVRFDFFYFLGVFSTLLLLLKFFSIGVWGLYLVIASFGSLRAFLDSKFIFKLHLKIWALSALFVFGIFLLTSLLGFSGALIVLLGFLVYRLFKGRKIFMSSMREIETILFTKPLDDFKKGERPSIYKKNNELNEGVKK